MRADNGRKSKAESSAARLPQWQRSSRHSAYENQDSNVMDDAQKPTPTSFLRMLKRLARVLGKTVGKFVFV